MNTARPYDMGVRSKRVLETRTRILNAGQELFATQFLADFSLADVAKRADVTVQTLIRQFKSKDGLITAGLERVMATVEARREKAPVGDVKAVVQNLMRHYEVEGQLALQMLAQQHVPYLRAAAAVGRTRHRQWVSFTLGPLLKLPAGRAREQRLDELCAVTDVFVWKLFRIDWGRSELQTQKTIRDLVQRVLAP